jgi:hypothetical protein
MRDMKDRVFRMAIGLALLAAAAPNTASAALAWSTRLVSLTVAPGAKKAVARFPFENTGATAVQIVDTRTNCDCTAAALARRLYRPGEKGEVEATLTIGDRTGRQDKTIAVTTTDDSGRSATDTLMMRVLVPEWFSCSTHMVIWAIGQPGSERTVDISIAPAITKAHLSVKKVEPARAETHLERLTTSAYRLRLRPADTDRPLTVAVTLAIDSADFGARSFEVFALVR